MIRHDGESNGVAAVQSGDPLLRSQRRLHLFAGSRGAASGKRLASQRCFFLYQTAGVAQLRDVIRSDSIPRLATAATTDEPRASLASNVGHAAFEFIESTYKKEGIRRFISALMDERDRVNIFETALGIGIDQFRRDFDRYLKERFKL